MCSDTAKEERSWQAFLWLPSPNCILLVQMKTTWGSSNAFCPWSSRGRARSTRSCFSLVHLDVEFCSPGAGGLSDSGSLGTSAFAADKQVIQTVCSPPTLTGWAWSIPLWAQNKQALIHQDGINGSWCLCKRAPYVSKLRRGTEMVSWKLSAWLQGWGHLGSTLSRLTLKGQLVLVRGQSNLGPGCI